MRSRLPTSYLSPARRGEAFTLIEVLVVVAIIGLLVAILVPSLRKARDQARETYCASNLGQFGKGFYTYAAEFKGYLCSGAFYPHEGDASLTPKPPAPVDENDRRDGPINRVGWVADLVNRKIAYPNEMLCPTNPAQVNQKLASGPRPGYNSTSHGPYTADVVDQLIKRGYNTNYTQAWYMARSEVISPWDPLALNYNRMHGKRGPLQLSFMAKITPERVPLLGDGNIEMADMYGGDRFSSDKCVKSLTDGPFEGPYSIQNYSDFGPAHGYGPIGETREAGETNRNRANILMADGHIEKFIDGTHRGYRDGQFGIDDSTELGEQQDLNPARVFDGVISMGRRSKNNWQRE